MKKHKQHDSQLWLNLQYTLLNLYFIEKQCNGKLNRFLFIDYMWSTLHSDMEKR